jgi:antitoxin component YwqK of YwqJK toxin-antitoxin module
MESKGFFSNNETTGIWEFFYETGNLKMRGALRQNSNYGLWEYFYESGQKSMEGTINGKNREGEWKSYYENGQIKEIGGYISNRRVGLWKNYFEDGVLKGEIEYTDDFGRYTEYFHSGKILGEGPMLGNRQVGHWRFYSEVDGTLSEEGDFEDDKKHGEWITYYPDGKISSKGKYQHDEPIGKWEYFFENGAVSSSGEYLGGQKTGYWSSFSREGELRTEANYKEGSGEYREYYPGGKIRTKGMIVNGKRQGKWLFYYSDGKKEGDCEFIDGKGTYRGYYPNGTLQTKGEIEGDRRIGTWEIYEQDGTLSGYYKPFYDDKNLGKEIVELSQRKTVTQKARAHRFTYFDERSNEFHGVIVGGNPVLMFAGRFNFGVEFYYQERLGHEFEFIGIRDPFFTADDKIAANKLFERGYSIAIKQKFYNPVKAGMWYFGHELRFTNLGHFINAEFTPDNVFTLSASEQRMQYGVMLGYRIMQRNNSRGFTLDLFVAGDAGYRNFDAASGSESYFQDINQDEFVLSGQIGFNLGYVLSFK